MLHSSVKLNTPCEFINVVPLNPQISRCDIKVCYVDDAPNRNRSIITKEVARKLANSLPGSPIVGYFDSEKNDFDEHTKGLEIKNGELKLKPLTRPYGFVDMNARCWFQRYIDDGVNEREYLVTEGYLWTGQYPECQQIFAKGGTGQSMELNEIDGYWTKDNQGKPQFFIINEALISALCILGDDVEPCFEGASIEPNVEFTLDNDFKQEIRNMFYQLQETLKEGGNAKMTDNKELNPIDEIKEEELEYKKDDKEKDEEEKKNEDETKKEETSENEENTDDEDEDKKKNKYSLENQEEETKTEYSLDDIPEYVELKSQYATLEEKYNSLVKHTCFKSS